MKKQADLPASWKLEPRNPNLNFRFRRLTSAPGTVLTHKKPSQLTTSGRAAGAFFVFVGASFGVLCLGEPTETPKQG